jgi:hypothetical protein
MAAVLTSEVEATLTTSNLTSRFRKLKDFLQEISCTFSPLSYFVTRETSVSPGPFTDNNPLIFVTLGVDMLTLNLSTTVIPVLAKTNISDVRNLIARTNSKAAATIAYSVVTEPRNKLAGIRIPSEAHNFSAKRPI